MRQNLLSCSVALLACVTMLSLSGCGGNSSVPSLSSACTACSVGGAVSGLSANESVTLLNNGADALSATGNGGFTFSTGQSAGAAYDVTVNSHTPGIVCVVSNGSGTVGKSNVTGVMVSCTPGTESVRYSFVGGTTDGFGPEAGLMMDDAGDLYGTTVGGGANGEGTVFKISASGTESVVHSFAGGTTDGSGPYAGLIMDSAGNLYGMTMYGGANSGGTVFKISVDGTESVLYSFPAGSFSIPAVTTTVGGTWIAGQYGGLVMDSSGNLYGVTNAGGTSNNGMVFKISAAGTESVVYSFMGGTTDGSDPEAGLIMDSAGNLYGTTFGAGAAGAGTVFKITSGGTETILHSFAGGTTDGLEPRASVVMDSAGNLYGTTLAGGMKGDGTVFKLSPTGTETILHSFTGGTSDGSGPLAGLIIDNAGNLYGTTPSGGTKGDGTVFKVSPTGTETVLYSFAGGPTDGANPVGNLVMDSAGNLYGTTTYGGANGGGTVFKIN